MTALAGLWRLDGQSNDGACERMLAAQQIYASAPCRVVEDNGLALGLRLAPLLPEDAYDAQPLAGANGRFLLVADLRLDNRDELASLLAVAPAHARTLADSALLLMAWERWQESTLDRLVGPFAFALWDRDNRRLVLARDPFGQRPLHYHRAGRFFAIASMPKGLHALGEIPRAPDEECVAEFLALAPQTGSRSHFKDIARVEPGHVVTVTTSSLTTRRYWDPPRETLRLAKADDYVDALRHHLDQAVGAQLRGAERAVGAHLSAGLDSSAIAATAARLLAPSNGRVIAFTSVPRAGYANVNGAHHIGDESAHAAATAALYPNMEHVCISGEGRSPFVDLDRHFFLAEQPALNLCNMVWIGAINEDARARKLKVMLSGQCGNASFSYDGKEWLPELLRRGRLAALLFAAMRLRHGGYYGMKQLLAMTFEPFLPARLWDAWNRIAKRIEHDVLAYTAIRSDRLAEIESRVRAREPDFRFGFPPMADAHAYRHAASRWVDFGNTYKAYLAGSGIDMRDPTTDQRLVNFCFSVPTEQFIAGALPRALARHALADRLPRMVLDERRRGVQAIDWHEGVATALPQVSEELDRLVKCAPANHAVDVEKLRQRIETWPKEGWNRIPNQLAYRSALLRGISAGHFLRRASGGNA